MATKSQSPMASSTRVYVVREREGGEGGKGGVGGEGGGGKGREGERGVGQKGRVHSTNHIHMHQPFTIRRRKWITNVLYSYTEETIVFKSCQFILYLNKPSLRIRGSSLGRKICAHKERYLRTTMPANNPTSQGVPVS